MIRVVIADDHPIVRAGVVSILSRELDVEVCGQASSAPELLRLTELMKPDIVITDYKMPDPDASNDGANLLQMLRRRFPDIGVIVLTVLDNPMVFRLALKLGVRGILVKRSDNIDVLVAVHAVAAGRSYLSEEVRNMLHNNAGVGGLQSDAELSMRETEVVRLFAEGMSVTEIASLLNRSKKTISAQKRCAMEKIGVETDHDLIEYARRSGLA